MAAVQQRKDRIINYKGDKEGLVQAHIDANDMEAAEDTINVQKALAGLKANERKIVEEKMDRFNQDVLDTSGSVLESFKRDPRGGMELAVNQRDRLIQENPDLAQAMPEFRNMQPEAVQDWWTNEYNRSSKNRKFEALERHRKETEKIDAARARAAKTKAERAAKKSYKKTKSDRQMELANLMANKKATPEEIEEFDLLSRTDSLDIAMRRAVKKLNSPQPVEIKMVTVGDKEYELVEELEDGSKRIRDPETGRIGVVR
jgi:hypothetical protein